LSPKARFLQFKILFKTQSGKVSPLLQKMVIFYLQANITPVISKLTLLPTNEVYLKMPEQGETIWGADEDFPQKEKSMDKLKALMPPKKVQRKGFQTIVWEAEDENGDDLLFSIYIRGENENKWRVLKEEWTDKVYVFDTLAFPDGEYFVRVVASDISSNPLGLELTSYKISRPLVIDNSLPIIKNFQAVQEKNKLIVTFTAEDIMSYIKEVQYLIRPEGWRSVFPLDGICDSKIENFNITATLSSGLDNLITVKVIDSKGNIGVHRQAF